jgi:hypothetical protein
MQTPTSIFPIATRQLLNNQGLVHIFAQVLFVAETLKQAALPHGTLKLLKQTSSLQSVRQRQSRALTA